MGDRARRLTVLQQDISLSGTPQGSPEDALRQKLEAISKEEGSTVWCMYSYTAVTPTKDGGKIAAKPPEKTEKDTMVISIVGSDGAVLTDGEEKRIALPIGFSCKKGKKPESPNQDNFVVIVVHGQFALYGVFDGHGPMGHFVSDRARDFLVNEFLASPQRIEDPEAAFKKSFTATQEHIEATMKDEANTSGTTCTMCYHDLKSARLTTAYVGDSRCVLNRRRQVPGKGPESTRDHKPDLPEEKARIEERGGRVIFDGYYNHRVFAKTGMYPGLNMSRAIGDILAHRDAGLCADAECKTFTLTDADFEEGATLLLCTDGVWEFIENDDALKIVGDFCKKAPEEKGASPTKEAMNVLALEAFEKWMQDSDNEISDDITGILVQLMPNGFGKAQP
eukprot:TRINITY_DN120726_c0_g1_i1.p1 TRINITY_DN120726_c0_g1~~TRINITY_DN120726_c0_g1_i1.p1  ORF type:complete len:393 (-),score=96.41 TRINITY_DN120726_c0_g1_i1:101-1279(-)